MVTRVLLKMMRYLLSMTALVVANITGVVLSRYLTGDSTWWFFIVGISFGLYALYAAASMQVDRERELEQRIADRLSRDN